MIFGQAYILSNFGVQYGVARATKAIISDVEVTAKSWRPIVLSLVLPFPDFDRNSGVLLCMNIWSDIYSHSIYNDPMSGCNSQLCIMVIMA